MSAVDLDQMLVPDSCDDSGLPEFAPIGPMAGVVTGTLVGLIERLTPLVVYPGAQATAAIVARTIVDLHAAHVGREVLLMFERGNPRRPIVVGWLRDAHCRTLEDKPGQVEVHADGERLVLSAREQLVLQCGKASITLARDGKVMIRGTTVTSHAADVNRIRGGSVQLN